MDTGISWRALAERRLEDNDGLIKQLASLERRYMDLGELAARYGDALREIDRCKDCGNHCSCIAMVALHGAIADTPPHLRGPVIQAYADSNGIPPQSETACTREGHVWVEVGPSEAPWQKCDECGITKETATEPSGMEIAQREADEAAGDADPRDRVWGASRSFSAWANDPRTVALMQRCESLTSKAETDGKCQEHKWVSSPDVDGEYCVRCGVSAGADHASADHDFESKIKDDV